MKAVLQAQISFYAWFVAALVALANPPRSDLVSCGGCGTQNDPDVRASCRNCGARL